MKSFRFRFLIAAHGRFAGQRHRQVADQQPMLLRRHPCMATNSAWRPAPMGFFAKALNLTDEQKTQMKAIMQKEHPAMKPLHQQERQIDLQLRQYVEGTYEEAKVRALATQKSQIETELTVAETRIHNQMYQLLTPDQQAKSSRWKPITKPACSST